MKNILLILLLISTHKTFSQGNPPWERPLKIARSTDGIIFTNVSIYQDSSGVPSAVKWKGDTLAGVFQWFRQPQGSPSWDRVAVKFSYDCGISWTSPTPIVINGLPTNYQRPFDPTLAVLNNDSLRIYFSSSDGIPIGGLDSTINTYSAVTTDGINYSFEPGARFDHPTKKVIDPSAIFFNGSWHYSAPIGAPQDGAYHCISPDGINFIQQNNIPSNFNHNWTGNFMVDYSSKIRFYGSGPSIWFNSSNDGFNWSGYVNTNITGGDPTVVKCDSAVYLIIFVGEPYLTSIEESTNLLDINIYPNPVSDYLNVLNNTLNNYHYFIYSLTGSLEQEGKILNNEPIPTDLLRKGIHILVIKNNDHSKRFRLIK